VKEIEEEWEYSWFAFTDQHNWAITCLDPIIIGLDKFQLISVSLMNIEAMIELGERIDNEEKADFIIYLARCKCCEIALVRHDNLNNCSIVCNF
jgi:hypothetical protein